MSLDLRVKRIVSLLVLLGAVPTCLAYQGIAVLCLLVLCLLVSWVVVDPRDRSVFTPRMATLAVVGALVYCFYRWPVGGAPPIFALGDFFALTACSKFMQVKRTRDLGQLFIISGLLMICGAILSGHLAFPLALVGYVLLGTYGLTLFHVMREQEALAAHRRFRGQPGVEKHAGLLPVIRSMRRGSFFVSVGLLAGSVVIFYLFPRPGGGMFGAFRGGGGAAITGFSESAQFGNLGVIQQDNEEVMRVRLTLNGDNIGRPNYQPYFRGLSFDRYSGSDSGGRRAVAGWHSVHKSGTQYDKIQVGPVPRNLIRQYRPWDKEARIVQEYWIRPRFAKTLFTIYPATDVTAPTDQAVIRWIGDHSLSLYRTDEKPVQYSVSTPTIRSESLRAAIAEERERYHIPRPAAPVDIPVSDRVRQLAQTLRNSAPDPGNPYHVAEAIKSYLTSGAFDYTLVNTGYDPTADPIDTFLFERKRGHCEFFASAMTVLCQLSGIPARLVHGFHGGDYNDIGEYYLVRSEHAHSWVEIFVPSQDWIVMDPTPSSADPFRDANVWGTWIRKYVDYLTFQWVNRFIAYDGQPTPQAIRQLREARSPPPRGRLARLWRRATSLLDSRGDFPWYHQLLFWTALLLAGLFVIVALRLVWEAWLRLRGWYRRRAEIAALGADPRTRFYYQVIRLLERRGHRRNRAHTPIEFCERLARRHPDWPSLRPVAEAYYQVEYGGRDLSGGQSNAVQAVVESLERTARRSGTRAAT